MHERDRDREKLHACSNESIDKFRVSADAVAVLSPLVTFHIPRSLFSPTYLSPARDEALCTLRSCPIELRRDKQFSVFPRAVTEDLSFIREFQIISPSGAGAGAGNELRRPVAE